MNAAGKTIAKVADIRSSTLATGEAATGKAEVFFYHDQGRGIPQSIISGNLKLLQLKKQKYTRLVCCDFGFY
jgi:hypothetical protein